MLKQYIKNITHDLDSGTCLMAASANTVFYFYDLKQWCHCDHAASWVQSIFVSIFIFLSNMCWNATLGNWPNISRWWSTLLSFIIWIALATQCQNGEKNQADIPSYFPMVHPHWIISRWMRQMFIKLLLASTVNWTIMRVTSGKDKLQE